MTKLDSEKRLLDCPLVAIIRGVDVQDVEATGYALAEGGITCMEVTFDPREKAQNSLTSQCVSVLKKTLPQVLVGVGTVVRQDMVEEADCLGCSFIVAPNTEPAIIKAAKKRGMATLPGAFTPTEVVAAYRAGATAVKLFPASQQGPVYIKAICRVLPHIRCYAVGGVTPENIPQYFAAGVSGVGVGAVLVDGALIKEGNFNALRARAQSYTRAVDQVMKGAKA